ncbi:redoxin domain-containing protein [Hymenobacter terrenus]|uniref:redoxin domain-containing protein n=1 Tax=Hymenobacter terrenus TaxID=1629124 RepID=UPI000619488B|nr:redoxin domain-containing protein [Hymenobacter terrenus]
MPKLTTVPAPAPAFSTNDVNGRPVRLADYQGQRVLLTFQRNVGCPVCNLRFHELSQNATTFQERGLVVLAVYESSAAQIQQYLDEQPVYPILIPNPNQSLYQLYGVERSMGKLLKGILLHGGFSKIKASKALTAKLPKQDGNADRVGADFLIDEQGRIVRAHYAAYVGDDLPVSEIIAFLK